MKIIRLRRNGYTVLFVAGICLTAWLGATFMTEAACAFGAISIAFLLCLVRQSRLLYDVTLIWDNRILAVPSALISMAGGKDKNVMAETVVSTFGMVSGDQIYRWGRDGVHGVRLKAVEIDKERIYLIFGDTAQTMRVELLHGMTQKQAVLDTVQKLWHETGVTAGIMGW